MERRPRTRIKRLKLCWVHPGRQRVVCDQSRERIFRNRFASIAHLCRLPHFAQNGRVPSLEQKPDGSPGSAAQGPGGSGFPGKMETEPASMISILFIRRRGRKSEPGGRTANFLQPFCIIFYLRLFVHMIERPHEDFLWFTFLFLQRVVNPFSFAPRLHETRLPEIGQVAGDFRLIAPKHALQKANANFSVLHQVEEPQPGGVRQGGKKQGEIAHLRDIYALTRPGSRHTVKYG